MDDASGAVVDLRSDTVTRPGTAMRAAMASAEVGDDVYGEDPTVNLLEERFAELLGKQAALFFPSGTMANQTALRVQALPASNVVVGRHQHLLNLERGAAGMNGSFQFYAVDDTAGLACAQAAAEAVTMGGSSWPPVSLLCAENTHMAAGGVAVDGDELATLSRLGPPLHLDGARIFNAAVALDTSPARLADCATTVMACVSKGLGAPVGSLLAGPADLIVESREQRKRLGGGMRQAGIVAAAGLYALEHHVERLADDHERAARLAEVVQQCWPGSLLGWDAAGRGRPPTNIVLFEHADPSALLAHLRAAGVLAGQFGPHMVRMLTHLDVDDRGVDRAVAALASYR